MPRYCLFGHNVTLANKFESLSEPLRIHVSPTTYVLLKYPISGFDLEPRPKEFLPKEFPANIEGTSYFLNGYKHKDVDVTFPLDLHIQSAIREYDLVSSPSMIFMNLALKSAIMCLDAVSSTIYTNPIVQEKKNINAIGMAKRYLVFLVDARNHGSSGGNMLKTTLREILLEEVEGRCMKYTNEGTTVNETDIPMNSKRILYTVWSFVMVREPATSTREVARSHEIKEWVAASPTNPNYLRSKTNFFECKDDSLEKLMDNSRLSSRAKQSNRKSTVLPDDLEISPQSRWFNLLRVSAFFAKRGNARKMQVLRECQNFSAARASPRKLSRKIQQQRSLPFSFRRRGSKPPGKMWSVSGLCAKVQLPRSGDKCPRSDERKRIKRLLYALSRRPFYEERNIAHGTCTPAGAGAKISFIGINIEGRKL
ncbi:Guanylate cyclase soluble subunit alpha-3 [Melipona quadrifasciata]|uniref:Guanylate cyclase soluble subunit alpha-3 n=1 Tax=Melipona quadrifasciata TaxID=166423 RepID=A0A0N0BHZ0_9HYME|nr:Guanylate cyclase soluble subunit alpha-3 [Melipona quadrifasciata]